MSVTSELFKSEFRSKQFTMESTVNEDKTLTQEGEEDARFVETANTTHENTVTNTMVEMELPLDEQHISTDEVSSEADASIHERADKINDFNVDMFSNTGVDTNTIQQNNDFKTIYNRMDQMPGNEQQCTEGNIFFERKVRKHAMELEQQIGVLEKEFRNKNLNMKKSVDNITSKNKAMSNDLDYLEKKIRQQHRHDLQTVKDIEHTINYNIKDVQLNKEMLDRKMSENEEIWSSVMLIVEREKETMKDQIRFLEALKLENLFQKDQMKERMKEMQKAKDIEVAMLRAQLQKAESRGRIHVLRQEIAAAKQQIEISEKILSKTIDEMTAEVEQLKTKREELRASLRNADATNLREKLALENRIEFLSAEVTKRNECISVLETLLRKTKYSMERLDRLSEDGYETFRRIIQRWKEDDDRLNVKSEEIKQQFHKSDGQSIVDTLTWVQHEIAKFQKGCIHETQLQLITDVINKARLGDYSGIRTDQGDYSGIRTDQWGYSGIETNIELRADDSSEDESKPGCNVQ